MPYLKECVESVLSQDFQDWEMLIGNNASTDGTQEYLNSLKDPRIRVFHHTDNLKIYGNLNFLFARVGASIVQILCADDYLLPGGLRKIVAEWSGIAPSVGLIRFRVPSDEVQHLRMSVCREAIPTDKATLYFFLFGNLCGNLSNVSFRTEMQRNHGLFRLDLPFAEDYRYMAAFANDYEISVSSTWVHHVRRHEQAASVYLSRKGELAIENFAVMQELQSRLAGQYSNFLLRLHSTLACDSQHRRSALRALVIYRNTDFFRYLKKAHVEHPICLAPWVCWIVFGLTGGGKFGREVAARILLKLSNRTTNRTGAQGVDQLGQIRNA